jgi:uncharacterized membrane protein
MNDSNKQIIKYAIVEPANDLMGKPQGFNRLSKVITWRIISTLCGWGITYLYLGSVTKSLEMTIVIGGTMTIIHYFFEKLWEEAKHV